MSQWRAYGSDQGYAIEFRKDLLRAALDSQQGFPGSRRHIKVRYGSDASTEVVAEALQEVQKDTNLGHIGVHAHVMALRLTAMLAAIKHPGFSEEREWRIILGFESDNREMVQFRSSPIAIVPFLAVPFPREAVIGVRVGPGRHVDVRREGLRRMLHQYEYQATVTSSEVPLPM